MTNLKLEYSSTELVIQTYRSAAGFRRTQIRPDSSLSGSWKRAERSTKLLSLLMPSICFALSYTQPALAQTPLDATLVQRPSGYVQAQTKDEKASTAKGEKLFDSLKLSENGLTCKSCHYKYEAYRESFKKPYPHPVEMATTRVGLKQVHADEMVQLCLVVTMDSKPLPWDSEELADLTAYVLEQQVEFTNRKTE